MPQGLSLGDETQSLEIVESKTVYRGAIWDVRRETFDYRGEKLTRDFVDHPGAVSVVALNDNAEIMMIRQYRHAIRALDWEIPAGLLDIPWEDPLVCAQRASLPAVPRRRHAAGTEDGAGPTRWARTWH